MKKLIDLVVSRYKGWMVSSGLTIAAIKLLEMYFGIEL